MRREDARSIQGDCNNLNNAEYLPQKVQELCMTYGGWIVGAGANPLVHVARRHRFEIVLETLLWETGFTKLILGAVENGRRIWEYENGYWYFTGSSKFVILRTEGLAQMMSKPGTGWAWNPKSGILLEQHLQ